MACNRSFQGRFRREIVILPALKNKPKHTLKPAFFKVSIIVGTLIQEDLPDLDLLQILLQFGQNYVKINEISELYMRLIMCDADFEGRCAVIMDAGRGIGLCIGSRFLQGGGNVVIAEADAAARMLF